MVDGVSNIKNQTKKIGKKIGSPTKDDANSIGLSSSPAFNMYRGYFPLWRKIVDWGWYKNGNTMRVFVHLLMHANFKESDYLGYTIYPGQVVSGRKSLAFSLGLGERQVRTALSHLKATNELTIKNCNKFSIITLINFDKYTIATSEKTNRSPKEVRQPTTSKNDKNDKNVKSKSGTPTLSQCKDYFKELESTPLEAEKFFDHFSSNGWKVGGKTPMKDWKAAARNWVRRLKPDAQGCDKCKGTGKYISKTGYDIRCSCPAGEKAKFNSY